ncbi:hypothetical protein WJX72_000803 [[Myrmecia] bisecta]|uniref:Uncharacterized protein n=1 Tax=[Myrmecia] bisecta TaxID=41462 RepID=A0AAW1Q2R2_9CHLO
MGTGNSCRWQLLCEYRQLQSPSQLIANAQRLGDGKLTTEAQHLLHTMCLNDPVSLRYSPGQHYCRRLMRAAILAAEAAKQELDNGLVDAYARCLTAPVAEEPDALTGSTPDPCREPVHETAGLITMRVSRNMLAGGTGCHDWTGGFFLSQFVLSNPDLVAGKTCLELGCGAGLASICLSRAGAQHVIASDGDADALVNCRHNFAVNGYKQVADGEQPGPGPAIEAVRLHWEDGTDIRPDVVVGADLLYDPDTIPALVSLLCELLPPSPTNTRAEWPVAYIATTVRREDTIALFKEAKEALEAAFKINQFPPEAVRRALGDSIGLTDQQVQVWFSHKRRKVKADVATLPGPAAAPAAVGPEPPVMPAGEGGQAPAGLAQPRLPSSVPAAPTEYYADDGSDDDDSPEAQAAWQAELRELLEAAKRALLVPYREDGPQLAFEFDDIDPNQPQRSHNKRKRVAVDNGYEMGEDGVMRKRFAGGMGNVMTAHARPPMYGNQIAMTPEQRARYDAEQKALRDLERSQQLQRRLEMSMRKDLEKAEKDRRRNMEKMERDKKREEERQLKEAERLRQLAEREAKKAELAAEKESRAEERRRQMELKRQEKEMLKALQQQEKQAIRLRQRDGGAGPKDDLDIEWETLLEMRRASGYGSDSGAMTPALDPGSLARPEFPPAHLGLVKAFPQQLGDATGGDLLMVWNFIHSFSDILGLWPCTVEELVTAVVDGEKSRLLGEIHVGLLRLLQADMEESHATGATQGGGGPLNFMDRAVVHCASMLEEAWAWGFDVDVWRAHLNPLTWPEVLREFAIATGCGRKRPKAKKEARPKLGTEGEDIVADEGGGLKLRLPVRFGPGTVKAAAWQVLAEAGTSGLTISEIARRIQRSGLRDLRSSKTPEASVAAALSRDVIFCRLAPATYALQALICHNKLGQGAAGTGTSDENRKKENGAKSHTKPAAVKAEPGDTSAAGSPEGAAVKAEGGSTPAVKHEQNGEARQHDEEDDEDNSDDEAEEEASEAEGAGQGEAWVHALQQGDYGALTLEQRCAVLVTLVHNAIDGPSVRACLDGRLEEAQRIRKQMWEEARLEKRRRQAEAAAKAKLAADEAQKVLERLQNPHGDASPSGTSTPVDNVIGPPAAGGPGGQAAHGAAAQDPVHMAAAAIAAAAAQHQHHGEHDDLSAAAASRERQQQRAETIRRAEEANAVRGEPLGMDRRYNRYWRFLAGGEAGRDGGAGRIFVETYDEGTFRVLGEASALEGLMDALDRRGAREGALYNALLRHRESIMRGMPSQPIGMPAPLGERPEAEQQRVEAEHAAWIWSAATQASAISRAEAGAGPQQRYREGDSLRVTKLKAEMLRVAGALPKEAVQDIWNLASWTAGVKAAASVVELRSALGELEGAIREDYLSKLLQRQPLLVRGAWLPIGNEVASALPGTNGEVQQLPGRASRAATPERSAAVAAAAETLAWLPATVAAIALRLWALDAALVYKPGEHPARDSLQAYKYIQRPALPMNADDLQGVGRLEAEALQRMEAGGPRTVSGQPIGVGGRARPSIFPPFPQAILQAAQREFVLPVNEFRRALDPNAPPEPAPTTTAPQISQPARPAAPASRAPAGSKGRGKPRGKAVTVKKAGWRGASVASGVELDSSNINTGSHMEAATDDESDVDGPAEGPVGRRQRPTILDEDEDLEISD